MKLLLRRARLAAACLVCLTHPASAAAAILFESGRFLVSVGSGDTYDDFFETFEALPYAQSRTLQSAGGLESASLEVNVVSGPDGLALVGRGRAAVQPGGVIASADFSIRYCVEPFTGAAPTFSHTARVAIDPADVSVAPAGLINAQYRGPRVWTEPAAGLISLRDGDGVPERSLEDEGAFGATFDLCEFESKAVQGSVTVNVPLDVLGVPGSAEFEFEVTIGNATLPPPSEGTEFRWVGGRSGAFADSGNWEPPGVPQYIQDERSDTALVQGGRNVTIDLAGAALARDAAPLLDPRGGVIQRSGRLVVMDSQGLRPVGGRLELDALSPDVGARSLEVGDGSQLLLGGGELAARHVAIGVSGAGELEVVGPAGRFETTGRLAVGASGEGSLLLRQGAQVTSAESLLGELEDVAAGSAVVQDAGTLWSAANLAVGHESEGTLEVRGGARVESELSYVDFLLQDPLSASATIGDRDAQGNRATWSAQSLQIGKRGSVRVEDGGLLDVAGNLMLSFGDAGPDGGSFLRVSPGGQVAATSLDLGGTMILTGDALLFATQRFGIGNTAIPTSAGLLYLQGPAAAAQVDGPSELEIEAHGGAVLRSGARASLLGTFVVGLDPASDALLRVVAGLEGTGEPSVLRATASAPQVSVVGASSSEPIGVDVPVSGRLRLEGGRIELAGPDHTLRIGRRGVLTGRGGTIAIDSPGKLLNRGIIEGGFTLDGSFEQPPGAMVFGQIRSPSGEILNRAALDPLAAAEFPRSAARRKAPPSFGPLVVTGDAALDGLVALQFGNGVAPRMGESFEVLDVAGTVTGAFGEVAIRGLVPGSYAFEPSIVGGKLALTSLTDAVALPAVSVKAKKKLKETAKKGGKIKLKRTGDTSAPLLVPYTVGGTAQPGVDYEALPGVVEIPARKKSATIVVRPIADATPEAPETIELELAPNEAFAPGLVSSASIELLSKDE